MTKPLDDHGQPIDRFLNRELRVSRAVDELIGFLKGVVADDVVSAAEVVRLGEWVLMNREVLGYWPVSVLAHRLNRIFEDGHVDDDERAELRAFIYELLGSHAEDVFVKSDQATADEAASRNHLRPRYVRIHRTISVR